MSLLEKPFFAIFAIQLGTKLMVEPYQICAILGKKSIPDFMHVLPWHAQALDLHLLDEKKMEAPIQQIRILFFVRLITSSYSMVDQIDKEDPWASETFHIKGPGEGTRTDQVLFC